MDTAEPKSNIESSTQGESFLHLVVSLYIPTFFLSLGIGIANPVLPIFAKSFDVSYGLATLVVTMTALGRIVFDIPVGIMMDRFGRRPIIVLGGLLVTISALLSGFAFGFYDLLVYRFITGVALSMWQGSRQTMIADTATVENRGRLMSTFVVFNMLGMSFGPALGGFVADLQGFRAPFFFYALACLVTLILSIFLTEETRPKSLASEELSVVDRDWNKYAQFLTISFLALAFANFANNLKWTARSALIPFYGTLALQLDLSAVGLLLSALSFSTVIVALPTGMAMDRFGRKTTLIPSLVLIGISIFFFPFTLNFTQALLVSILMGLASGMGGATLATMAGDMAPKAWRGVYLSAWRFIGDLGALIGPLLAGFMIDFYGLGMAFYALAAIIFVSTLTSVAFLKETLTK